MTTAQNLRIASGQFEGCLLGGLIGDCLGYPYENEAALHVTTRKIQDFFDQLLERKGKSDFQYTDDSSMTKTLAKFIINSKIGDFDPKILAQQFTEGYLTEKRPRCYGSHVGTVFSSLQETNFDDPFKPSHAQFGGQGSYGNGAGMRVAPLALMTIHEDHVTKSLIDFTIKTSRITHGHPAGILGGHFQAMAVRQALLFGVLRHDEENLGGHKEQSSKSSSSIPKTILNAFEQEFNQISSTQFPFASEQEVNDALGVYKEKIQIIKQFLDEGNQNITIEKVKTLLGVRVTAAESIPTAFFCFLAAFEEIPFVQTDNQFQRTIQFAISLGGDTDTIGAMAGNIAGAYLGIEIIGDKLPKHCEDHPNFVKLGQRLYTRYKTVATS